MLKLTVKYYFRKCKIWIAMVCVLLCTLLMMLNQNEQIDSEIKEKNLQAIEMVELNAALENSSSYFDDKSIALENEMNKSYFSLLFAKINEIEELVKQGNYDKMNTTFSDYFLLQAQRVMVNTNANESDLFVRDYLRHQDELKENLVKKEIPKYNYVSDYDGAITTCANQTCYTQNDETVLFPHFEFKSRFYEQLKMQKIDHLTFSTTESGTLFVQFIRYMFPFLPIAFIALLFFDSISEDRENGVIKTLLSQPFSRIRYINKKILANFMIAIIVFIIPLTCVSAIMGVNDHFRTLQAPILANVQGVSSLSFMENPAADPLTNKLSMDKLGLTEFFSLPQKSGSPNSLFDIVPMWQFTLLCIAMVILILLFCVLLNMLLNVIFKNKFVSLALSIMIMVIGMAIISVNNYSILFALIPFTFMNPVEILSGLSTYTYLNGMLVLSVYCIILYILISIIFKRKDIV